MTCLSSAGYRTISILEASPRWVKSNTWRSTAFPTTIGAGEERTMTSTTGTFSALHAAADSLMSLQTHRVPSLYTCRMSHDPQSTGQPQLQCQFLCVWSFYLIWIDSKYVLLSTHQLMNHHKNVHENYPRLKRTFLYGAKRKYVTYTNTWKIVYKIMKICLDNNKIFCKLPKNNLMLQINYYHLYYI